MRIVNCSSCNEFCGCISVAQYRNDPHEAHICKECYDSGFRCWVLQNTELVVLKECPENARQAVLYWDEGQYVTKDDPHLPKDNEGSIVTYPSSKQPAAFEKFDYPKEGF